MPPTSATTGPEGHHRVESLDPPETAQSLGLTPRRAAGAAAAAERATGPEAVTTVPPPLFSESKRRRAATPSGSASPGEPVAGSPTGGGPLGSDATSSTTTTGSFPASSDDELDELEGRASSGGWRDRIRAGGRQGQGRPPGAEPVQLRDIPQLRDGIAQALHAVGDELNDRVAPGTELFLTDPADEQGLAEPVSRLILRRMPPDLAAASNPDFADVIAAAIVMARYAVKQLNVMRALRRAQRAAAEAGQVPYGTPPTEQPAAAAAPAA